MKVSFFVLLICATLASAQTGTGQTSSGPSPHPTRKNDEQILQQETFSPVIADVLVARIGDGLAGHNRKLLLSAFDKNDSQDYTAMKEQINAVMEAYRSFRVHYRVESSSLNPDGTATVHASFQIEQAPTDEYGLPIRRDAELVLSVAKTKSGWRVVSFSPQNFFIASQ